MNGGRLADSLPLLAASAVTAGVALVVDAEECRDEDLELWWDLDLDLDLEEGLTKASPPVG